MTVTKRDVLKLSATLALLIAPAKAYSAPKKITMTHCFTSANFAMLEDLVRAFQKENGEIEVDAALVGDNWSPLLQATLRAGLVGDLPDISHQGMTFTRILMKNGFAQPLDDVLGGKEAIAGIGIPPSMMKPMDGKLYCLPFGTALPVIYLNLDLLAKAGLNINKPPQTWPELFHAMAQVNALGRPFSGGYIEYSADNGWMFQNLVASLGGKVIAGDDADIAFDNDLGLEALRLMQQFGAAAGSSDMTRDQARQAFNGGSMGVLVRTASGIQSISQAASGKFALGIVDFPVPADSGHLVGAGHGLMMFSTDEGQQRVAAEYLKFATSAAGQAILVEKTGYLPANLAALEDKAYFADYFVKNPYHKTLVNSLSTATDWDTFPNNSKKIFDSWIEEMRKVVVQETEPKAALAAMAGSARSLMAQKE